MKAEMATEVEYKYLIILQEPIAKYVYFNTAIKLTCSDVIDS